MKLLLRKKPGPKPRDPEDRFWEKVEWEHPTERGCWLWVVGVRSDGYGRFYDAERRAILAHRWAYEWAYGPIPDDLHVLHKCDNPPCVNPEHLFLGTQVDNTRDMDRKGRRVSLFGVDNPRARFTEADIRYIRDSVLTGPYGATSALAREYGTARTVVSRIARRKRWKHVL